MYISREQSHQLDKIIKSYEVVLRSFVAEKLIDKYPTKNLFEISLDSINTSSGVIYSGKFNAKISSYKRDARKLYAVMEQSKIAITTKSFNNDVPYVSEIIDLILIYFNDIFSGEDITKDFSSIEEFHYCCTVYHLVRNNLSHPASRPTTEGDANKVIYFLENLLVAIPDKYYWYCEEHELRADISKFKKLFSVGEVIANNLQYASISHKALLCRENIIKVLYSALIGTDERKRLAGSVVLYGYGGVGKTSITTEFFYRLLRDRKDGKNPDIDFLLFYSSKDEHLKEHETTGEFYIDKTKPEYSTCEEFLELVRSGLGFDSVNDIFSTDKKGIIAIDNIENVEQEEKEKILDFIKSLPRNIQFIVTSRNEEPCEEKIHIQEFNNDEQGLNFIEEMIEIENYDIDLDRAQAKKILEASKGNALIIVQSLNMISRGVTSFDEITLSLDSLRSRNAEIVANFMYKNTFDSALKNLDSQGLPINLLMQIVSLYDESIELYSISKLARIDVSDAERVCNYLSARLILNKQGEYYKLNEFAKRFVFIKLLPDRITLVDLKSKIKNHKLRMREKLEELDRITRSNKQLYKNVKEWQPRNYIDKIIIAELFSLYGEAAKYLTKRNYDKFSSYLRDFDDHLFITNHPYVPLQKARLLKMGYRVYRNKMGSKTIFEVEQLYEQALDSIEFDYNYLLGTQAHASLLMFLGIHITVYIKDYARAIRFLEEATEYDDQQSIKSWFIIRNYLCQAYLGMYENTNNSAYKTKLVRLVDEVSSKRFPKSFNMKHFKEKYSKYLK